LFDGVLADDPKRVLWKDFTDSLMVADGFSSLLEGNRKWFIPHHGRNGQIVPEKEFVILRWET
jgi:hypothetical protein